MPPPREYASSVYSECPPSYATIDPALARPSSADFSAPYRVGGKLASFVTLDQTKRHLKLLAAFRRLRQQIEDDPNLPSWIAHLSSQERWSVFVAIAVTRLEGYLKMLKSNQICVPPLDVGLVLHTWQLNPGRFEEDVFDQGYDQSTLSNLLECFADSIDASTLKQQTSRFDVETWERIVGQPYDPLRRLESDMNIVLTDRRTHETMTVPCIGPYGLGYAQDGFAFASSSGDSWTHERMGVLKLAQRLRLLHLLVSSIDRLLGTMDNAAESLTDNLNFERSDLIYARIRESSIVRSATSEFDLAEKLSWSLQGARRFLAKELGLKAPAIDRITSCYTRRGPFSLDLVAATLRQGTFIEKMHGLGWLNPGRFEENDTVLRQSIARYHNFMDLLSSDSGITCVPTLDIDLIWHTHQLSIRYRHDMFRFVGRFVDHDDSIEGTILKYRFQDTATAWEKRFHTSYSNNRLSGSHVRPPGFFGRQFGSTVLLPNSGGDRAILNGVDARRESSRLELRTSSSTSNNTGSHTYTHYGAGGCGGGGCGG
ncbi:hypothetical protein JCM8547_007161 [Rhodosporidiobolus lusitaniae]